MTKETFEERVKISSSPTDFKANKAILDDVDPNHYETYIACIMYGSSLHSANQITKILIEVSEESVLSSMEAFLLITKFQRVTWFIKENPLSFT